MAMDESPPQIEFIHDNEQSSMREIKTIIYPFPVEHKAATCMNSLLSLCGLVCENTCANQNFTTQSCSRLVRSSVYCTGITFTYCILCHAVPHIFLLVAALVALVAMYCCSTFLLCSICSITAMLCEKREDCLAPWLWRAARPYALPRSPSLPLYLSISLYIFTLSMCSLKKCFYKFLFTQ